MLQCVSLLSVKTRTTDKGFMQKTTREIETDDTLVHGKNIPTGKGLMEIRLVKLNARRIVPKIDGLIVTAGFHPLSYTIGEPLDLGVCFEREVFFLPEEPMKRFKRRICVHRSPPPLHPDQSPEIHGNRDDSTLIPVGAHIAVYRFV